MDLPPRRPERPPLASINVTPLVDVMLVLLIIFLVTASLGQEGITVSLPQGRGTAVSQQETPLVVTLNASLEVYVDGTLTERRELSSVLKARFEGRASRAVYLKADRSVSYGDFVQVVDQMRAAGAEQLGMLTETARD